MCFLYWRIWRETEKRYKDLTTLFLVSARVQPPKSSSGGGFWRSLLAAPSAVVGAVVKGGGAAGGARHETATEKTETDAEVTSTCETSEGTVPVSTSGSLCSSHWSTMGGGSNGGGATNSNTANSIYTILITLPPATTPTGDQPPSSTSVSTPDSHSKFYVNESDDMQPISIKQFSVGGGMGISDSGRRSGHTVDHSEEKVTDHGNGSKRRSTTSTTPPRMTSSAVSQPKSEKKAAKTLSAILLAFVLTWTPYNVLVLLKTFTGTISGTVDLLLTPISRN